MYVLSFMMYVSKAIFFKNVLGLSIDFPTLCTLCTLCTFTFYSTRASDFILFHAHIIYFFFFFLSYFERTFRTNVHLWLQLLYFQCFRRCTFSERCFLKRTSVYVSANQNGISGSSTSTNFWYSFLSVSDRSF